MKEARRAGRLSPAMIRMLEVLGQPGCFVEENMQVGGVWLERVILKQGQITPEPLALAHKATFQALRRRDLITRCFRANVQMLTSYPRERCGIAYPREYWATSAGKRPLKEKEGTDE